MLENRFSRSPARHPARRPGCGREGSGAAGWRKAGPRPLAPRAASQAPASSSRCHPLLTDASGGSCRHRLLCGARTQPRVRGSFLSASVLPRSGTAPAGAAPTLTCSSASPGVPNPHEGCLQVLKAASATSEPSVSSPLHTLDFGIEIF